MITIDNKLNVRYQPLLTLQATKRSGLALRVSISFPVQIRSSFLFFRCFERTQTFWDDILVGGFDLVLRLGIWLTQGSSD